MPSVKQTRARPHREKVAVEATSSFSKQVDVMIGALHDWRGERLSQLRRLVKEACPDVVEEIKWRKPSNPEGVPVWSHNGIVCLANFWKGHVRLTFSKGAKLKDPKHVFNAALNGNWMRALDLREGDTFDEAAFKALILAAVALNDDATGAR